MKQTIRRAAMLLALVLCLALPASAEVRRGTEYCFSGEEFAAWEDIDGVFVTAVPDAATARVVLGSRVIRSGDVLAAGDLARLVLRAETPLAADAALCFRPIVEGKLGEEAVFTMHIAPEVDEAPVALDGKLETYRNLPNTGTLQATNDDDGPLTFRIQNRPRRGTVELAEDGSYTYTPKKNKVGDDEFTFTVTDAAGNVSAPGTVRISILKPQDAETFDDLPLREQFYGFWLREQGLFGGERVTDKLNFGPDKAVTRGEFLCMAMDLAGIDPEIGLQSSGFRDQDSAPAWMQPYLGSAMRRGIVYGYRTENGLVYRPNDPITRAEAAALLNRALELGGTKAVDAEADEALAVFSAQSDVPAWARDAALALSACGIDLGAPNAVLTRAEAAEWLYRIGG